MKDNQEFLIESKPMLISFYLQIKLVFLTRSIKLLCETNRRLNLRNYKLLQNFYNLYRVCYSLPDHQHFFQKMLLCKNLLMNCIWLDRGLLQSPQFYYTKGSNSLCYRRKLIRLSQVNTEQSHSLILFP